MRDPEKPTCIHGLEKCGMCESFYNRKPMRLAFGIFRPSEDPGERAKSTWRSSDNVALTVDSGNPGGEPGEFGKALTEFLTHWYEGGRVVQFRKKITPPRRKRPPQPSPITPLNWPEN